MGKVINMFERKSKEVDENEPKEKEVAAEIVLEEAAKKYKENKERLKKERIEHNKKVTKSYRLKK